MPKIGRGIPDPADLAQIANDLKKLQGASGTIAAEATALIERCNSTIRNFLIPRLEHPTAPFNVAFVGPTGSGKSTLLNSVAGQLIAESGAIRPTTTTPLVYTSQAEDEVLMSSSVEFELVAGKSPVLNRLSLIDTPDIDSTNRTNRRVALDVLATADLIVFVTSASRYADLVPWELLRSVTSRGVPVIHCLNRVTAESAGCATDLKRLLRREGMKNPVVTVAEHRLEPGSYLPAASIRDLRRELVGAISALSRQRLLVDALNAVRADLSELEEVLEQGLAEYEALKDQIDGQLGLNEIRNFDLVVAGWRTLAESAQGRYPWIGHGRRSRVLLSRLSNDIVSELSGLIESDLRMFEVEHGKLVINLTATDFETRLGLVDDIFEDWFRDVDESAEHASISNRRVRRRVLTAVDAIDEVLCGNISDLGSRTRRAVDTLRSALHAAYKEVRDEILSGIDNGDAEALEIVRAARSRLGTEPALLDA